MAEKILSKRKQIINNQEIGTMNKYNIVKSLACLALATCFAACKKNVVEVLPGNIADMALNFYSSSDIMDAAYGPSKSTIAVYVDKYEKQSRPLDAGGNGYRFPTMSYGFLDGNQYPTSNNGTINYVRFTKGDHRLFFTDAANTIVLDTIIKAKAQSYNCIYLADAVTTAGTPAKYAMIIAEEDRKSIEGKTGVRFIHLSADAGNITCNLQKVNGDLVVTQAGELAFGQVSPYQFFSQDDAASGGLLRFTLNNTANGVKLTTGVPFASGRNYVVLITGFKNDQQRQVNTDKNPDGSVNKEIITVSNNLRTEIRTSY